MKLNLRNRYLKGIFAIGLALSMSYSSLPFSSSEDLRREEQLLRFDIGEKDYRRLSTTSGRQMRSHVEHAVFSPDLDNEERLRHLKIAEEISNALHTLMPHMHLVEQLNTLQQDLAENDYFLFYYDLHNAIQDVKEFEPFTPKFSARLYHGLKNLEDMARQDVTSDILHTQLAELHTEASRLSTYLPLQEIDQQIKQIKKLLKDGNSDHSRLVATYENFDKHLILGEV
ncbi:MAG: hypothetical protein R3240_03010 [Gammaproteobacteria bacterium]|nr:hypothetical protein [Gammaproteobacteria bacterium]